MPSRFSFWLEDRLRARALKRCAKGKHKLGCWAHNDAAVRFMRVPEAQQVFGPDVELECYYCGAERLPT